MARVRVFEAATEGFRLIRREPKAVLVWGLALFVLLGLPMMLYLNRFAAAFLTVSDVQTEEEMLRSMGVVFAVLPLMILGTIAGYTVVGGAILRAVITPEDRQTFYLRLSTAELWMALSALVGFVMAYIASFVIMLVFTIPIVILTALATGAFGAAGVDAETISPVHWVIVLAMVIGEVFLGYLWLRFSMAPLMSFDERRFRLFESWRFTHRSGWRLFGLVIVVCLAMLLIELLLLAIMFGGAGSWIMAMAGDPVAMQNFADRIGAFYASPWMLLWCLFGALFGGAAMALMIAPFARAYVMLREGAPVAVVMADAAIVD